MRVELTEQTRAQFALCDAELRGISWLTDGRDVRFDLVDGSGRAVRLTCAWATALQIELAPDADRLGLPITWECSLASTGQSWQLRLEFPGAGFIALDCDKAVLESSPVA